MKTLTLTAGLALALLGALGVPAHAGPMNQQGVTTETFSFTDASGTQWQQTRTDTWTLTYVLVAGTSPAVLPVTPAPTPAPAPTPDPGPPPSTVIAGLRDGHRNWLPATGATVHAGAVLEVEGAGFGTVAGTVVLSPGALPVQVTAWGPLEIAIIAPAVPAAITGPLVVTPASGPAATSTPFTFSP